MATPKWYAAGMEACLDGTIDLDTSTLKLALYTSATAPVQDTHDFRDDSGTEASGGSGYSAGGFTLASLAVNRSSLTISWDAANISQAITGGPFAFRYGIFYKSTGSAATDNLLAYVDFGAQSITDATLNITLTDQLTVTVS